MHFRCTILTLVFMIKAEAEGSSLNIVLGIQWSSYENLSKDFGGHVVLPIMKKVADELLRQNNMDITQNWILMALVIIVSYSGITFLSFFYIKKKISRDQQTCKPTGLANLLQMCDWVLIMKYGFYICRYLCFKDKLILLF